MPPAQESHSRIRPQAGTINIILLLDANLTRGAMLNAFITATEAKTAVIQSRNIRTPDGDLATGTSTDTITIATTGKGKLQTYAGSVTTSAGSSPAPFGRR